MKQTKAIRSKGRRENWTTRQIGWAAAVGLVCQIVFLWTYRTVLADHYARRAQEAVASRKPQDAAALAQRSLTRNPHQGYAAFFLGIAESERGREAAEAFRQAVRTMPHRAQALRELAAREDKMGDRSAAAQHLAEALAIEPVPPRSAPIARVQLGRILLALGLWGDAMAQFDAAIGDAPTSRFVAVAWGFALLGSPQFAPRGIEFLSLLCHSPALRPQVIASLREIQKTIEQADPRYAGIERLLEDISTKM